jgi:uncharacterized BrkB/YihY/UPF0761 family membrane protein
MNTLGQRSPWHCGFSARAHFQMVCTQLRELRSRIYGNLGAIVGFLTWIWLSLVIILFGAELNRELERRKQTSFETKA